jgi:hypothetical protein
MSKYSVPIINITKVNLFIAFLKALHKSVEGKYDTQYREVNYPGYYPVLLHMHNEIEDKYCDDGDNKGEIRIP